MISTAGINGICMRRSCNIRQRGKGDQKSERRKHIFQNLKWSVGSCTEKRLPFFLHVNLKEQQWIQWTSKHHTQLYMGVSKTKIGVPLKSKNSYRVFPYKKPSILGKNIHIGLLGCQGANCGFSGFHPPGHWIQFPMAGKGGKWMKGNH